MADDFKSYQSRQGLQYQADRPKFIQDLLDAQQGKPQKPTRRPQEDDDDEMPLMVDSEGNVLTDEPGTPVNQRLSSYQASPLLKQNQTVESDVDDDEEGMELVMEEFQYEALDPEEVTKQPSAKRTRPVTLQTTVRSQPKSGLNNSRLLSFTLDDDEEED